MYTNITVKQILDRKGYQVWSIDPNLSIFEALRFMAEKNIGAVLVIEEQNLVGVFSERDYARKVVLKGRDEKNTLVKDVMTDQVIGVEPHQKLEDCLALMTGKFIRHLPVIKGEKQIIGVISIGDVVKEIISEQEFVIDQLVNYISGEQPKPSLPDKSPVEQR